MVTPPNDIFTPQTQSRIGLPVLILTANNVEDIEFFYPYYRLIEAGYSVDVVTPQGGEFKGKHGTGLKDTRKITDVSANNYQLLYLPGGQAPAELKGNQDALNLTRQFVQSGKLVAALCHGPQILAAANVIQGHRIAAWPEVENEVKEAGGIYVNQETVVDGPFITGRWPADLPSHLWYTLQALNQVSQFGYAQAQQAEMV